MDTTTAQQIKLVPGSIQHALATRMVLVGVINAAALFARIFAGFATGVLAGVALINRELLTVFAIALIVTISAHIVHKISVKYFAKQQISLAAILKRQ